MGSATRPAASDSVRSEVEVEARDTRLRSRMGQLYGFARVNGEVVLEGTMTFALGPASGAGSTKDAAD